MEIKFNKKVTVLCLSMTLALLLPGVKIFAQDLNEGLILHYTYDDISETLVPDASNNENNGSLIGGAFVLNGKSGKGVLCNDSEDYIRLPDNLNKGLNSFTFATWIRVLQMKKATRFFDLGSGSNGENNFMAFIPSYGSDDGYMNLRFRPASGTALNIMSTEKCPTLTWVHIAVSYDWDGSKGSIKMFLNGNEVASFSNLSYNIDTWLGNTSDNFLGHSRWPGDENGLKGIYDDTRFYNRALSQDEILMLTGIDQLYLQYDLLDLGDLSAVSNNLDLPSALGDEGVSVSWASSAPTIISTKGIVSRPDYFDASVTLTATVRLGSISKIKTFEATVLATDGSKYDSDLLVRYDFSNLDGANVTDVAEKGFTGTLKNAAKIITMGDENTNIFNVLNLGTSNGYFDMGSEMGKVVSQLKDYTISAYFRIDNGYTGLDNFGNFLWSLSNSNNALSNPKGYIICSLKDQSLSITPSYYTTESGNQDVGVNKNALKGNWHCFTYTQTGGTGIIYIDGMPVAKDKITNTPASSLLKSNLQGTLYNWIGRSCYTSDAYLQNTLVYDFRMYSRALEQEEIASTELNIFETLKLLENAYMANVSDSKTAETNIADNSDNIEFGFINIFKKDNEQLSLQLNNINHFTANTSTTVFNFSSGTENTFNTNEISKITFSQWASSIPETAREQALSIYPNPAKNVININIPDNRNTLRIYTITGSLLITKELQSTVNTIDISGLTDGVYIMKCGNNVLKFSKQ